MSVELAVSRPARRRERLTDSPRRRAVLVRFNDDERSAVASAAERAGLTTTAYVATVALDIARAAPPTTSSPLRDALAELMATRGQLRRFGTNVNQAVAALNATGEAPPALLTAVAVTARAVQRVDLAAAELHRRLR